MAISQRSQRRNVAHHDALAQLLARVIMSESGPVVDDLGSLATDPGYRATALHGRYGATFREIDQDLARGVVVSVADALARLSDQRDRWVAAGEDRDRADMRRDTGRTVSLPRNAAPRIVNRGVPSGPIGDPGVATHGSVGPGPAGFARRMAEMAAAAAIDAARSRSETGKRPGSVAAGGYTSPGGTYCARPGYRRKRRNKRK